MQQVSCGAFFTFVSRWICLGPSTLYVIALACIEIRCACARVRLVGCVGQMLMMSAVTSGWGLSRDEKGWVMTEADGLLYRGWKNGRRLGAQLLFCTLCLSLQMLLRCRGTKLWAKTADDRWRFFWERLYRAVRGYAEDIVSRFGFAAIYRATDGAFKLLGIWSLYFWPSHRHVFIESPKTIYCSN